MLSYMKCGKTECEKPRLLEKAFCEEHAAAERETAQPLINQKIPLDECLVEYRNNGSQLFMRFEDGTVLRFELAERGTTPPEGLRELEDALDTRDVLSSLLTSFLVRLNCADKVRDLTEAEYEIREKVRDALNDAATQRAPVEQGRGQGLVNELEREIIRLNEELRWVWRDFTMYMNAWCREIGGFIRAKSHQIDGYVLRTRDALEEAKEAGRKEALAAAPDHAREGAVPSDEQAATDFLYGTHEKPTVAQVMILIRDIRKQSNAALNEAEIFIRGNRLVRPSQDETGRVGDIVRRALADGKEGGE